MIERQLKGKFVYQMKILNNVCVNNNSYDKSHIQHLFTHYIYNKRNRSEIIAQLFLRQRSHG